MLPDGTKVWLNASSSLRFSSVFEADERRITLTGEGYFEVSPAYSLEGKRRPFIVQIGGRDVRLEVLGTQFNVNAYADEPYIRTTLIKGSVKVITSTDSTLLKPAQQAEIRNDQIDIIEVGSTGIDAAKAWKEGYFNFKKADVQTILREISRWYDMEIEYKGKIPSLHFDVALRRNTGLKDVLRVLSMNGIDCRIKGKKIIVTPRV
jgi:ferric-dicitrate binding protein FerR (iron transport regulator)